MQIETLLTDALDSIASVVKTMGAMRTRIRQLETELEDQAVDVVHVDSIIAGHQRDIEHRNEIIATLETRVTGLKLELKQSLEFWKGEVAKQDKTIAALAEKQQYSANEYWMGEAKKAGARAADLEKKCEDLLRIGKELRLHRDDARVATNEVQESSCQLANALKDETLRADGLALSVRDLQAEVDLLKARGRVDYGPIAGAPDAKSPVDEAIARGYHCDVTTTPLTQLFDDAGQDHAERGVEPVEVIPAEHITYDPMGGPVDRLLGGDRGVTSEVEEITIEGFALAPTAPGPEVVPHANDCPCKKCDVKPIAVHDRGPKGFA